MLIKSDELRNHSCIKSDDYASVYDLENGILAKIFNNVSKNELKTIKKKVALANNLRDINGLIVPIDSLETEDGFRGYIQGKRPGRPFVDDLNESSEGLSLSEIATYFYKLEDVLKPCHEKDMIFPDLSTGGNVLYEKETGILSVVDYDGAQIQGLETNEVSSVLFGYLNQLLSTPKYYRNGLYTPNVDNLTMLIRFFYYATKIDIARTIGAGGSADYLVELTGLSSTTFAKYLIDAFNPRIPNISDIGDAIKELENEFTLTRKINGQARKFIRK